MKITLDELTSSAVTKVEYTFYEAHTWESDDDHTDTLGWLVVTFRNGRTYEYEGVRVSTFTKMVGALSLGKFINEEVKPFHEVRELTNA